MKVHEKVHFHASHWALRLGDLFAGWSWVGAPGRLIPALEHTATVVEGALGPENVWSESWRCHSQ